MELGLIAVVALTCGLFANWSGWTALAQRYPAPYPPEGETRRRQTIALGPVRWRRCVEIAVTPQGLYLATPSRGTVLKLLGMFRNPPLLIPWSEFVGAQTATLYWMPAVRLSIGQPEVATLTVNAELFEAMRPYLPR